MKRFFASLLAVASVAAFVACSSTATQQSSLPYAAPNAASAFSTDAYQAQAIAGHHWFRACGHATIGFFACDAIMSDVTLDGMPGPHANCLHLPGCYGPTDLQAGYNMTALAKTGGKGQTVAIVDAYGYKQAASDLAGYRKFFGLPACGAGCFTVLNQQGHTSPLPAANTGWDGEQALDVDMVSAMCPNCKIVLIETNDSSDQNLVTGVAVAEKLAHIVSNSWGGAEFLATYPTFDSHKGVVVLASAGDSGAGVPAASGNPASPESQPCGFQGVICVGGTSLKLSSGHRVSEVVWQDFNYPPGQDHGATGSGCSKIVKKPSWQHDTGCKMRSASDVSANADPFTGVVIQCTPCNPSSPLLAYVGGTSEASPLLAAMYALAGNATTATSASLYAKGGTSSFFDITSGYNDKAGVTGLVCSTAIKYICVAGKGYDGPTGWGTPNGVSAL